MPGLCLVVVFTSARLDADALAARLAEVFGPVPVVGCTTAGEIGPDGYRLETVMALGLAAPDFAAETVLLEEVDHPHLTRIAASARHAVQAAGRAARGLPPGQMFAFTLFDGLAGGEEVVVSALHNALGEVPLCGGSAGDCLRFARTAVLHGGRWHDNAAVLVVVATPLPFRVFKTEHFIVDEERVVITGADPRHRVVTEINAEPAAREYARVVGLDRAPLTPMVFASHPMVVRVGGANFVRSIQKVNDDGSLTFFCAIDEGIVLRVARGIDLVANLEDLFQDLREHLGVPVLTLAFDCILRGLEMDQTGVRDRVGALLAVNGAFGFATYGEQFQSMHVNQTFTGVAIGRRRRE